MPADAAGAAGIRFPLAIAIAVLLVAPATRADDVGDDAAVALPAARDVPGPDGLTGRDIYEKVVANRFHSYVEESTLVSGSRGGRAQATKLQMHWKDFRNEAGEPDRGVLSKSLVKYTYPFDIRFSGYLILNNASRPNDQFVYLPARRKVKRVNLRGEAVFGTDFSFEDVVPREVEESDYRRMPDEVLGDQVVYVVEAVPNDLADSEYSRFVVYVDRKTFVPLQTRYWDSAGVEVKRLEVDPASVREFDGIYVPMRMTMRNLQLDSYTALEVTQIEPNPDLPPTTFELRRLESH